MLSFALTFYTSSVFVITFHVCDHICYWQVIIVEIDLIIYGKFGAIYHIF